MVSDHFPWFSWFKLFADLHCVGKGAAEVAGAILRDTPGDDGEHEEPSDDEMSEDEDEPDES